MQDIQGGSWSVFSLKMKTVESYWAVLSRESVSVILTATFLVKNKNGLNAYGCFRQEKGEIIQHVFRPINPSYLRFSLLEREILERGNWNRQFAVDLKRQKVLLLKFFTNVKKNLSARCKGQT